MRTALLLAIAILGLCVPGSAQTYTCLPDTAEAADVLRDYVVRLVTGTDSETVAIRNRYGLPVVAASKVAVVNTASTCKKAGDAYHAAVTPSGTPRVSRTLAVIKVGSTRYVVLDPNEKAGEFELHMVFDRNWNYVIGFAS